MSLPNSSIQANERVTCRREVDEIPGYEGNLSFYSCLQSLMFDFEHSQSSRVRIDTAVMLESKCLVGRKHALERRKASFFSSHNFSEYAEPIVTNQKI